MEYDLSKAIRFAVKISVAIMVTAFLLIMLACGKEDIVEPPKDIIDTVDVITPDLRLGEWVVVNSWNDSHGSISITKDSIYFDFGMWQIDSYKPYVFSGDTLFIIYGELKEPYFYTNFDGINATFYQMLYPDYVLTNEYYQLLKQ